MTAALENIQEVTISDWKTLNTAMSPTKLPLGESPDMSNVWVDEKPGSVITSPGYQKVGTLPSGLPGTFCLNFFKSSDGSQTFVVSDNATIWTTVDFLTYTPISTGLSASFQLRGKVIRDKLWLTNGQDTVRVWDGSTMILLNGSGGTPTVPVARYIDYFDERVWLYHVPSARSKVFFSALTDPSGNIITPDNSLAWPNSNNLQISEGDADYGTGMLLYRGYLHFFKQYSIWRLVGYDEYNYTRVKTRASSGTRFNESIQVVDSLVHFIGLDGIYVFDGEETQRISDLVGSSTVTQEGFGFDQLQQPNTNNQFWETSNTLDWQAGTVPTNLDPSSGALILKAADGTQSDFSNGVNLTHLTSSDNPGALQLAHTASGVSNKNVALNQSVSLTPTGTPVSQVVGVPPFVTDNSLTNQFGFGNATGHAGGFIQINTNSLINVTTIVIKGFNSSRDGTMFFATNQMDLTPSSVSATGGNFQLLFNAPFTYIAFQAVGSPVDVTITFPSFVASSFLQIIWATTPNSGTIVATEIQVLAAAYFTTGKFVSKPLDYSAARFNAGNFNAFSNNTPTLTIPSPDTLTFFTQSSDDGLSWDAEVAVVNGTSIGSAQRRFLRWVAYFTSDGVDTPTITNVWLPAQFISPVHATGGNIITWGPFESDNLPVGQTISFYYRTAATAAAVPAQSWKSISPGAVLNDPVTNAYVQFKLEISAGSPVNIVTILSVTINWISGMTGTIATFQNVASFPWRNRYWLSGASAGASANDTILIRGKKTFGYPWQLKDWNILSFTRYQDSFYGCSSLDGSIFRLDTGFSKDGAPMDSFFETGDQLFGGFYIKPIEVLLEVERMGSYNLFFGVSFNRGLVWTEYPVALTPSSFAQSYVKRINVAVITTDRIRFRLRTNAVDQPFQVHNLKFYYKLETARGSVR